MTLAEALQTLREYGLLSRATELTCGDVHVKLAGPETPVLDELEAAKRITARISKDQDNQLREWEETMYASSEGQLPPAVPDLTRATRAALRRAK